jgi:hypothetical protein
MLRWQYLSVVCRGSVVLLLLLPSFPLTCAPARRWLLTFAPSWQNTTNKPSGTVCGCGCGCGCTFACACAHTPGDFGVKNGWEVRLVFKLRQSGEMLAGRVEVWGMRIARLSELLDVDCSDACSFRPSIGSDFGSPWVLVLRRVYGSAEIP